MYFITNFIKGMWPLILLAVLVVFITAKQLFSVNLKGKDAIVPAMLITAIGFFGFIFSIFIYPAISILSFGFVPLVSIIFVISGLVKLIMLKFKKNKSYNISTTGKIKIYLGTDHAGYELKNKLKEYLSGLGHEVVDKGPFEFDKEDDYPDFIFPVAQAVAQDYGSFGVILGGSGQGEAMCANRVKGARAGVYYGDLASQVDSDGKTIDMVTSLREHNNANILSIGARFLDEEKVKVAIKKFIETSFPEGERHVRRINKLDL